MSSGMKKRGKPKKAMKRRRSDMHPVGESDFDDGNDNPLQSNSTKREECNDDTSHVETNGKISTADDSGSLEVDDSIEMKDKNTDDSCSRKTDNVKMKEKTADDSGSLEADDTIEMKEKNGDGSGSPKSDIVKRKEIADDRGSLEADDSIEIKEKNGTDDSGNPEAEDVGTNEKSADDSDSPKTDDSVTMKENIDRGNHRDVQHQTTSSSADITGFRCVDVNLLVSFISKFPCPSCQKQCLGYSDPKLRDVKERKTGLASVIEFTCGSCGTCHSMATSVKAGPNYEVNSRYNAAMFTIGNGFTRAKRFCSFMKMPEPKSWMNKRK